MCTYSNDVYAMGAKPRRITSVSIESSSHLHLNMYNLSAFDLCGCSAVPCSKA